jgi:fumarate reductase subunit C
MTDETRNPGYTLYHPRWHRRRIPIFWWLGHVAYTRFIVRELTSVAVAYAALLLLVQVWAAGRGAETYARFQEWLAAPPVLALHGAVLLALVLHTVTWLALAPKALVIHVAGRRLPDAAVIAGHYAAWLGASAAIAWGLLR